MENLKGLLLPNTFNKCGSVGVFLWAVIGVILLGVFAEMDNGERSDFRCSKAKLVQDMDFVRAKCFEQYDKRHNKYRFPVYGFVLINFLFIGTVSAVYSQVMKSTVDDHHKESGVRDAERQRPPETRRLFMAYCCQLMVRFAFGIVAIVLQTQLLYPSIFPSDFNCDLSSPAANASASKNSTKYECHNQRARQKTVSMQAVIMVNGVFAVLIFIEFMAILILRVQRGRTFLKDSEFLKYYLQLQDQQGSKQETLPLRPEHVSQQEPLPLGPEQQDLPEEPPQQTLEQEVDSLEEPPKQRAEQHVSQQEQPPLRPEQQDLPEEPPQQTPEQDDTKHVVDTVKEAQLSKFVSDHIKKGEWHVFLQCLAGLLGEQKLPIQVFTNMLPVKTEKRRDGFTWWPTDSDKHLALTILKCLFEPEKESHFVVKSKLEEIGFNAVDFSLCGLAPSDCTAVVHALKNVSQISCINLSNNHIGSLGCVEIRKLLDNGNCQITQLYLRNSNIDDNGVLELTNVITNSKLTEIRLGGNNITDNGVLELCKVINNSNLTVLGLGGNNITQYGVFELCKVITNSKLTWLVLSENKITDVGVLELCKVITNSKITELGLSVNKITDVGVLELCKVIANSKLTKLYLGGNKITEVSLNNLCDVLTNPNCKLTWLELSVNKAIPAEAKQRLKNANPNSKVYFWYN